jgi:chromosome segregation ATPase
LVALELEIDKVQQNIKPLQSELALGSHKFTCLKEELDDANQKTPLLLDERQFIQKVYDRQKEQQEVLAKLEDDISKQAGKNQVLTVELGRPINLHRWRELQVTNPEKWAMIERVHNLQKKVVLSTDKLASQSSILDSRKKLLAKLKEDVSQRQSLDSIQSQLRQMKASHQVLSNEIKANESILQHRAEAAEALKAEVVELEKKRMELKTAYIVSVINS